MPIPKYHMEQEVHYLFMQEGSTEDFRDVREATDRIGRFLPVGCEDGSNGALIVADQETFATIHR